MLSEAAKAARREYKNAWARRNRDKVRQQQHRYWERKAAAQRSAGERDQQNTPTR